MIDQELTIESLRDDLKQLINARFIENKPRRSHIPNGLRASYRARFFESYPIITQCWLIFSSNLNDTDQAKLALKLLMYRDLDPLEWIKSWIEDGSSEVLSTVTETSEGMHQFIDQAVEPPLLSEVKERQHVKWLLRTVTSHEGRIVKRLNKLWSHLDMLKVARTAKSVWMPLLQYTLKWRSDHEWARPNGEETLLDTLQNQIDQLGVCAAFEDFESFVEILSERYRGVGVSKKRSKKGPAMDDRMRILRRVQFWSNYRDQTSLTRFIISPNDHEAYHSISLEELMLGDESIIACESLPSDSPLMVLRVNDLVIVSALTDSKQPTRFILLNAHEDDHDLFSLQGKIKYYQLESYLEREDAYYHAYLWQVLFTLILEGGGVSPDRVDQPFVLGGDKIGEYVKGAGLKFTNQELKRQSSQLTDLLRSKPSLLSYLSESFGELLTLPQEHEA